MVLEFENYYQLLHLDFPSSQSEIRLAYKQLAKEWHHDKHPDNESYAANLFSKLNFAYQVLGNNQEKENYDFLYQKYYLNEPYLNPDADICCSTGTCGVPAVFDISNRTPKKRKVLYILGLGLILAMVMGYVLNALSSIS